MKSKQIGKDRLNSQMGKLYLHSIDKKKSMEPGESVSLRVTDIQDPDFIFVSSPGGAGVIPRVQLIDGDGSVTVNPGEVIDAFFLEEKNGERIFTIHPVGAIARTILRRAFESRTPLQGRVLRSIKGGYEVQIGDETAFCPASQMDGEVGRGAVLKFIVMESPERNIVVSHRLFADMQRQKRKEEMVSTLEEGSIVSGTVVSLRDFGAFVDIGSGVEGLVPVSELSYKRVNHPSEVLQTGQEVRVKVMAVNWKEDRITLSLKELQQNPWQGALPFHPGDTIEVSVESIRPFGVFVKMPDGFRGLIPASETGVPRGKPIDKEFAHGQQLTATIMEIDREKQKISLSASRAKEAQDRKEFEQYMQDRSEQPAEENISSFGRILMKSLKKDG